MLAGVLVAGFGGAHVALGAALVAGACICWGVDNAITSNLDSYSPATITLAKGLVAGTVNLTLGLALEHPPNASTVLTAAAIGAIGYGLSITLWGTGARLIGAARGQTVFALAPFVGATLAWPILSERVTGRTIAAFAIASTGVMLVATSRHGHRHAHDASTPTPSIPTIPTTSKDRSSNATSYVTGISCSLTNIHTCPTSITVTTTDGRAPTLFPTCRWGGARERSFRRR